MKIACISDLHIKKNDRLCIKDLLVKEIKNSSSSLLVIAGDISSRWKETISLIEKIENESGVRTVYVPGNHDLWSSNFSEEPTEFIYGKFLNDSHCLSGKIIQIENLYLTGDIGWYDYSFGSREYSFEDFEKMELDGRIWQDSLKNQWTENNIERTSLFISDLKVRMENINKTRTENDRTMLVTHMLNHEAFKVPENWKNWKYFNGFLGSTGLMNLCLEQKPDYALCGHVHFRKSFDEKKIHWMCRCLGYSNEWHVSGQNAEFEIQHAMEYIEF